MPYKIKFLALITASIFVATLSIAPSFAANSDDTQWDTFEVMPYRMISVKGDPAKFRAIHWLDDGTTGGIKSMGFQEQLGDNIKMSFAGHAIPGDNNWGTKLDFTGANGGYMTLSYGNFRKFYEVYGGYYPNFPGASAIQKLRVDPEMDIGVFFFEIGSNSNILETAPGVSLSFQRRTKEGIKSSTQWGTITSGGLTRKIGPAFQEESLTMDTIALKGNTDVGGVNIAGEQRVDFLDGRVFREMYDTATDDISHEYKPYSRNLVSAIKADKWIVDDKTHVSAAYRYQHTRTDMSQLVTVFLRSTRVVESDSHNRSIDGKASQDTHSWVQSYMTNLTKDLNFNVKLKQELLASTGSGFGEGYTAAGSNRASEAERKATTLGESLSLRYSGIPKTSLYTDWDFEQTHNWFWRTRVGTSQTEALDTGPKTTGVIGARYYPAQKFNVTTNYRFRKLRDNFDTYFNDDNGFLISRFNTTSHEWNTRFSWKPFKWFENALRVQLGNTVYRLRNLGSFTTLPDWLKSQAKSDTFTYNAILQPSENWLLDMGYSLNLARVSTPATQYATANGGIPKFLADVHTWIMTASYAPTPEFSVFSSALYSMAENYEDESFGGIPYGVDNKRYDVSMGLQFTPNDNITIKPQYAYYSYRADKSIDFSNYSAHAGWIDVSFNW